MIALVEAGVVSRLLAVVLLRALLRRGAPAAYAIAACVGRRGNVHARRGPGQRRRRRQAHVLCGCGGHLLAGGRR